LNLELSFLNKNSNLEN